MNAKNLKKTNINKNLVLTLVLLLILAVILAPKLIDLTGRQTQIDVSLVNLTVIVQDTTGILINQATVTLSNQGLFKSLGSYATGPDGKVIIPDLEPRTNYYITIIKGGYKTWAGSACLFDLTQNKVLLINIEAGSGSTDCTLKPAIELEEGLHNICKIGGGMFRDRNSLTTYIDQYRGTCSLKVYEDNTYDVVCTGQLAARGNNLCGTFSSLDKNIAGIPLIQDFGELPICNDERGERLWLSKTDTSLTLKGHLVWCRDALDYSCKDYESGQDRYEYFTCTIDITGLAPPGVPAVCTLGIRYDTDQDDVADQYCDAANVMQDLKLPDVACTQDYECQDNICLNNKCKSFGALAQAYCYLKQQLGEMTGINYTSFCS